MNTLRFFLTRLSTALAAIVALSLLPSAARADSETAALSAQTGSWSVVETQWMFPEAAPEVSKGLIADRRMVGNLLQETLHVPGSDKPLRIDYLGYDAMAGEWRYVSIETRIAVAPMTASSFGRDPIDRITVRFDPFAAPAIAPGWAGRFLHMEEVIVRDGPDHETKDQYFVLADGTARHWLMHRYDYRRQR